MFTFSSFVHHSNNKSNTQNKQISLSMSKSITNKRKKNTPETYLQYKWQHLKLPDDCTTVNSYEIIEELSHFSKLMQNEEILE